METVLVTGGTGFLAGWLIRRLLEDGYKVRTTVRSESKISSVTSMLANEGISTGELSFAVADLMRADGWDTAMDGISKVFHVASPLGGNNHENPELIAIAKSGVGNVLHAAIKAGVSKIVMTSSQAACYPDKNCTNSAVNESFWTNPDNRWITNYMRSKLVAEKTAWDIINAQDNTQFTTILPGSILGPYMGGRRGSTDMILEMLLKGTPSPNVIYPVVDVRDLAELHILAMENSATNGERFIAQSEEMTMPEMAKLLQTAYPDKKVSTMVIPDFIINVMAKFQVPMKVLNTMVGTKYHNDTTKAKNMLGWSTRSAKETVLDTAAYLIENNIV